MKCGGVPGNPGNPPSLRACYIRTVQRLGTCSTLHTYCTMAGHMQYTTYVLYNGWAHAVHYIRTVQWLGTCSTLHTYCTMAGHMQYTTYVLYNGWAHAVHYITHHMYDTLKGFILLPVTINDAISSSLLHLVWFCKFLYKMSSGKKIEM